MERDVTTTSSIVTESTNRHTRITVHNLFGRLSSSSNPPFLFRIRRFTAQLYVRIALAIIPLYSSSIISNYRALLEIWSVITCAAYTMYNLPTFHFMCRTPSEARAKVVRYFHANCSTQPGNGYADYPWRDSQLTTIPSVIRRYRLAL